MDERDPVGEEEFVFRRIPRSFVDSSAPIFVRFEAFRPTPRDVTGLSVFRAHFTQPREILAKIDPAKIGEYFVAQLAVRDLRGLGLTLTPEPMDAEPPGHAVIPQLSWPSYLADKTKWRPVLVELAKLASKDLVHRPS